MQSAWSKEKGKVRNTKKRGRETRGRECEQKSHQSSTTVYKMWDKYKLMGAEKNSPQLREKLGFGRFRVGK